MSEIYYSLCKECEHIYHCFARETAEKIQNDETDGMYLHPSKCDDFYPEIYRE